MFTPFFKGIGEYKIPILLAGEKVNSAYFIKSIVRRVDENGDSQDRGTRERRVMLHFDNPQVHSSEAV
jgi:hypothetical protein